MAAASTPDELLAQRAKLDEQIAISNLPGVKAFQAAFASGKVATIEEDFTALLPLLASDNTLGTPFQQATAFISTYAGVKAQFDREVTRIQALADAQAAS